MTTFGTLQLAKNGQEWILEAEPHVVMRAKRVFARLARSKTGDLILTNNDETARDLDWFTQRYPLDMSAAIREQLVTSARRYDEKFLRLAQLIDSNYQPPTFELAFPARDYQAREASILLTTGGYLNADVVGLGKTVMAVATFTDTRTLPAVVVTLPHLQRQWEREVKKFAPRLAVHRLRKGTPYELPKFMGTGPDVLILNYHKLAGWAEVLHEYCNSVVFDEVQELRHEGTQRYRAARLITKGCAFRLGLSATPIFNYGGEIYSVLDILQPGCLGSRSEFGTEWCADGGYGEKASLKDPKAFGAWAKEQFLILRHTRKDVGRELPPVTRSTHVVDTDNSMEGVKAAAAELARTILSGGPEAEKGERWRASEELSSLLRQATGVAKAPYVAQFVRMLVESGEQVVLFGWHRKVYDIWLKQLNLPGVNPILYTGTESPTQKEAAAQAFISGKSKVLIVSLRSGAGLNGLQDVCSVCVFGELDWSPGVIEQCIGRLDRDGQNTPVMAYFLVADDGADPPMAETLGLKREQVEGIRDPHSKDIEHLTDVTGSNARRLAEAYLKQIGEDVPDIEIPLDPEPSEAEVA